MALIGEHGLPAVVGETLGYWLDEADFVFRGDDHEEDTVMEMGRHSFPRDWPAVYDESIVLRAMLKRKGPCAAKRVSVVPNATEEQKSLVADVSLRWLQSLANAESVKKQTGFEVVEGWAVYDILDDVTGAAFAAERYWWNSTEDGTWVDFSPRGASVERLLLAEAIAPLPRKRRSALTQQQLALSEHLWKLRCPKTSKSTPSRSLAPKPEEEEWRLVLRRVELGVPDSVSRLRAFLRSSPGSLKVLIQNGACAAVARQLGEHRKKLEGATAARAKEALREGTHMLACLTWAAVKGGSFKKASESIMEAEGVEPLVELLLESLVLEMAADEDEAPVSEDAAWAIANLCYRCPGLQERAVRKGGISLAVRLLREKKKGPQRRPEAAAAAAALLWHLTAGTPKHALTALGEGAAELLLAWLADCLDAEEGTTCAQQQLLGALMSLASSDSAREMLGEADGIPTVCHALCMGALPQVRWQAAGALLALLSESAGNCKRAAGADGGCCLVEALLQVAREGSDVAKRYAAGALANLLAHSSSCVPQDTGAAEAAFRVLLCNCPVSPGDRRLPGLLAALANLSAHLPAHTTELPPPDFLQLVATCLSDEQHPGCRQALAFCVNVGPIPAAKAALTKAGVLRHLVSLLDSTTGDDIREQAAGALANLMEGRAEATASVSMALPDLARKLVSALETECSSKAQRQMLRGLALLASRRGDTVRRAGGLEVMSTALDELPEGEHAWEPFLGLLNLAPKSSTAREDLLLPQSSSSRSSSSSSSSRFKGDRGNALMQGLVRGLGEPGTSRYYAAGALANLTAGAPRAADAALSAGALEPLLQCLVDAKSPQEARTWAAAALGQLLTAPGSGAALRRRSMDVGALGALLSLLKGSNQELALFALLALSTGELELLQDGFLHAGGSVQKVRDLAAQMQDGRLRDDAQSLLRLLGM